MKTAEAIQQDSRERRLPAASPNGIAPAVQRCIGVLTPTLGAVSMWWHTCMVDLIWPMNTGKGFIPRVDQQGGEVGETRNALVTMALQFEAAQGIDLSHLMWVDDDVIITRLAMLQLLSHDRDIAAGVYFTKGEVNEPLIFAGPSSGTMSFKPDETFEAWGWAQGLSLVRTEVYKRMKDELDLGADKYGNPAWYKVPEFGVAPTGQITMGGTEDFHFFGNASKLGYRALIDCSKHAFGFHYDAKLKTGYPKKQWDQFFRREPVVWPATRNHPEVVWS